MRTIPRAETVGFSAGSAAAWRSRPWRLARGRTGVRRGAAGARDSWRARRGGFGGVWPRRTWGDGGRFAERPARPRRHFSGSDGHTALLSQSELKLTVV